MGFTGASSSIVTALTKVATEATTALTSVAPVAISVMGVFLVWRYGIKFFKSVSK